MLGLRCPRLAEPSRCDNMSVPNNRAKLLPITVPVNQMHFRLCTEVAVADKPTDRRYLGLEFDVCCIVTRGQGNNGDNIHEQP